MKIYPFKAFRPVSSEVASKTSCPPYDVISTREASELAKGNPDSFLNVIRPEIAFNDSTNVYDDSVYKRGATELGRLLQSNLFDQDEDPSVYVYRMEVQGVGSSGIFTCVGVDDYDNNRILKHELTRPDKEDDRTRHLVEQQGHAEPVMLLHESDDTVRRLIASTIREEALTDFTAEDGVRHQIWRIENTGNAVSVFSRIRRFYVADGHHRCAAASRAAKQVASGESNVFPAAIFSSDEMNLMAYNRVVLKASEADINRLFEDFDVLSEGSAVPDKKGDVSIYSSGKWRTIQLRPASEKVTPVDKLDAQRLQTQILSVIFGIEDPRTDQNIRFVGGIRGTEELEKMVDSGKAALAFSMHPTSIKELMAVSDAGLLMPPKSTWFEPKLRSGLLIHMF